MNVYLITDWRKAIAVESCDMTGNDYDHSLCIFNCYVCCTRLKCTAIGAFGTSMSNALMHLEHVRVHWLNRTACLVAEVQRTFVTPLRSAFDTAIKAESFPISINNLQAT